MTESVSDVIAALRAALNDASATQAFASMGLRLLPEVFGGVAPVPENPDPTIYIGIGDPNSPASEQYARWPMSKALEQIAHNGPIDTRLGQQWIVFIFTLWEHEYRKRLAVAHGCSEDELVYPLLGDVRRLRNDVVHHHGIATVPNTGKCEVLRHWFPPGETISLRGEHFAEFHRLFPWESMAAGPRELTRPADAAP